MTFLDKQGYVGNLPIVYISCIVNGGALDRSRYRTGIDKCVGAELACLYMRHLSWRVGGMP